MFIARLTAELAEAVGRGTRFADEQAEKTSGGEQARWIAARDTLRKIGVEEVSATAPTTPEPPELVWVVHRSDGGRLGQVRKDFEDRHPYAVVTDAGIPEKDAQWVRYAVPAGFGSMMKAAR